MDGVGLVKAAATSTKATTDAVPATPPLAAGTVTPIFIIAAIPAVVIAAGLLLLRTVMLVAVFDSTGASTTLYPAGAYPALVRNEPTSESTWAPVSSAKVMAVGVAVAEQAPPWPNSMVKSGSVFLVSMTTE